MTIPGISKSRFTQYLQCPKLGYVVCHPKRYKHLAEPMDWLALHLTGEGTRVGAMARQRFAGGRLVEHVWDLDKARSETAEAMRDDTVDDIFEAAFAADGLLCRVDILHKVGDARVDIIEVKAANGVKSGHLADVAFQMHVLERAGLEVRSVSLMHFDPDYVHSGGGDYDLAALLLQEDVTEQARQWKDEKLPEHLAAMRAILEQAEPPGVMLKNACTECPYYRQVCSVGAPLHPVCELGRQGGLQAALHSAGILDLRDIPPDFPGLGGADPLVLPALESGGLAFDAEAFRDATGGLTYPLWFMDFETFMPGLPIFAGMRPWQQIPFQWSLHVLEDDGSLRHEEFLQADGVDPRRAFAEALIAAVGDVGSVIVYNKGMESERLGELARDFPDLAGSLLALDARIVDLLVVVRQSCYHLGFHGSRSLKAITPILAPHLSYQELGLKEGVQAMEAYERLTDPQCGAAEKERLRADLLTYCRLDTQAMVEVLARLMAEDQKTHDSSSVPGPG